MRFLLILFFAMGGGHSMMPRLLRAPFPWFGGKSRCASIVWKYFGDVPNLVDPFCGSLAIELGRPTPARTETVNDKDCYISNFWRAVTFAPEEVAFWANWPVNEADLHARHRWLVNQTEFRAKMMSDPHYFDAKIAGWWVWGISQWIGSGWCSRPEWMGRSLPSRAVHGVHANHLKKRGKYSDQWKVRPNLTKRGSVGIRARDITNSNNWMKRPALGRGGRGVGGRFLDFRMPDLGGNSGATGKGIHRISLSKKMPTLNRADSGVMRKELKQQIPQLGGDGSGSGRGVLSQNISLNLVEYMFALQDRLRTIRVCCGDWERILGPSPTTNIGITGVFLDPPYSHDLRDASVYSHESESVAVDVRKWAIANGENPKMRIALCGYEGEHKMPKHWSIVPWKANGGYGNQSNGRGKSNAGLERIWFSPACLKPEEMLL